MAPKKTDEAAAPVDSGMTPFQEALIKELHAIGIGLVALVASRPAVPMEVTKDRLAAAAAQVQDAQPVPMTAPPPRDAEVKQAAQVTRALEVVKPADRVLALPDVNAIIEDAVKRNVVTVPAIKKALQDAGAAKVSELAPESYDGFLKGLGL